MRQTPGTWVGRKTIIKGYRMIKHCHNCSACCEVIAIDNITHEEFYEKVRTGKVSAIHGEMMKPISREEAYKRNPMIVAGRQKFSNGTKRFTSYFTCTKLKDNKCSIYEDRPYMCSGYPFYDRVEVNTQSHADLCKAQLSRRDTPYSPTCTYVPTLIDIRNI